MGRIKIEKIGWFQIQKTASNWNSHFRFLLFQKKLGIELDGGYHEIETQQEADEHRTNILAKQNIKIIRFKNEEVLNSITNVLQKIKEYLNHTSS